MLEMERVVWTVFNRRAAFQVYRREAGSSANARQVELRLSWWSGAPWRAWQ